MAGRSASNTITRYAGVQVETSAMGLQIPNGWGTFRVRCNLLDYLDFKSSAQKAGKGGGKGGAAVTGYNYSATIVLGVCEGPIDGIDVVYVDSNIYTNGGGPTSGTGIPTTGGGLNGPNGPTYALHQAGLGMMTGAVGQAPWSYLTANHPDHAIGYSGLAIVYAANYNLDGAASPPNHSFEVIRTTGFGPVNSPSGAADVDPSLVLADFFQNTRTGVPLWPASGLLGDMTQYQDYCLAAGLLLSPVIDQERSASDFINEMLLATNSTCVWSEGVLKFIPYGDTQISGNGKTYVPPLTAIYDLDDDDFVVDNPGDPPLQTNIKDQSDAYNVVQLEYLDRTNQYNMAIALASDAANVAQFGPRRQDPTTVHVICDPTVAGLCAQLYLQRTLYIRAEYTFKLGWMFALLEPGDIVALTDVGLGLSLYPVRITQIDEDEKYGLKVTCEDYPIGIAHSPLYAMQAGAGYLSNQNVDPGGVEANLLLYSGDQTNAAWTKTNATVAGAVANDQYGLVTACAIVPGTGNAVHAVSQTVAVFEGLNYTFGVCIQANVHKDAWVDLTDGAGNGVSVKVDSSAGTILVAGTAAGNATVVAATIAPSLVSGIWQVTLCGLFPTAAALTAAIYACDDSGNITWTGDASDAINVSQAQLRQGVALGTYAQTQGAPAGPILFNPPSVLTSGQQGEIWAAVAGGPWWGGCIVWASVDGASYQQIGTIDGPARYGSATTSFASAADPDTTDSLGVDLGASGGALIGAAMSAADNGGTMCLLDGELICYETASLTNPSRYTLGTYIRRGYLGTPIAAHAAGAPFIRLDDAIFDFPYTAANIGQTISVKFQSFNLFGRQAVSLADCIAYEVNPVPAGASAPAGAAWTAAGGVITNNGVAIPALEIRGASDNPSAQGVIFYYRVHGVTAWTSAGLHPNSTTAFNITSVASGGYYDVGVAYQVNGVVGAITTIASNIQAGAFGNTIADGIVLFSGSTAGAGSFTFPTGYPLAHADVILTGADGGARYLNDGGVPEIGNAGGQGGNATYAGAAVAAGDTISWSLGTVGSDGGYGHGGGAATAGGASTVTSSAPSLALTANGGAAATLSTPGAGGTASGGTTNTTGAAGGGSGLNSSITIIART